MSAVARRRHREPVAWWLWPYWMALLALALVVFYVILTPIWMAIRLVAWLSERRS